MLYPPLAIAALFFHPLLHARMWREAKECYSADTGARAYGHPFTCDLALQAQVCRPALIALGAYMPFPQADLDAKPQLPGETNVLVGVQLASDKTDVERERYIG